MNNLPRYLILAALAVVGYLLLNAWRNDYVQPAASVPEITQPQNQGTDVGAVEQPTSKVANAELPQSVPKAAVPLATVPEKNGKNSGLIEVKSDLLTLKIDPTGGDIVAAALNRYPARIETPDVPFSLLARNGRTYVAQSGLIGPDGPDASPEGRPLYSSEHSSYQLAEGQDQLIFDLRHQSASGVVITKRFTLTRGSYLIDVRYLIDNSSQQPWQGNFFAQLKRDNSPDPSAGNQGFGVNPYLGTALYTPDKPYTKVPFDQIAKEPLSLEIKGGWVSMVQHYFISAWVADPDSSFLYETRKLGGKEQYIIGFKQPTELSVAPGQSASVGARLYIGPKIQKSLKTIAPGLDLTVDYGWLWFIAQPLFWILDWIHGLVQNWGVAIILLTVLVKAAFFHLSATSYRSMAKMRNLQPKMLELRDRHGNDRQQLSQATMELYRKEKVNPLGGCLPILVQMPVFIALYWTLLESVELRHASFLWLNDLSVMDPYFVLPIVMGVTMFIQQLLSPAPPDPMQAKVMRLMPVMFTFFFLWFPSGLVLYWLVNNLLSIAQQWFITRQIEAAAN
ncbi:MAG TPA: membrane protein insertase YidC [Pseudomonadales bacterium]|nr:membrane protein insertase YidC [Pseudomonadales bacterium]